MIIVRQLKNATWGKCMPKSDADELIKLSKDLDDIKYKKLDNLRKKLPQKWKIFFKISVNEKNPIQKQKIIIYIGEDNLVYFDLNHTVNLFDNIKAKNKKYDEYKNNIVFYDTRNNEFGGLYLKEFISKEIFFKIILHTNSVFSNKFKDDVAKLLDDLTNTGDVVIKNNALVTVQKINPFIEEYEYTQTYNNIELLEFIKEQIRNSQKINYNKYVFTHIMYFFIITLDDPHGKYRILCKIGYTDYLLTRIKSLPSEYKCEFYLPNVKRINRLSDEQLFHSLIKKLLPHLFVSLKIGNHEKEETYVFDRDLYALFCNYEEVKLTNVQIKLEEETKQIFAEYFDNVEKRFELEIIKK